MPRPFVADKPKPLADMTGQEFARLVGPPPAWLEAAWAHAAERGLDALTTDEIDAEVQAQRKTKRQARRTRAT